MTTNAALAFEPESDRAGGLTRADRFLRFASLFFSRPVVVFGTAVIVLALIVAVFAPWIAPYDPYDQNLNAVLQPPTGAHWLGTDSLGRDLLVRIMFGSRVALLIGVGTVAISASIGSLLGLIAGYFGGLAFTLIMRFIDGMSAVPALLFALVIATLLSTGVSGLMIAIGVALLPGYARLMAGQVLSAKQNDYVLAARSIGVSPGRIMRRHILPNCMSPLIVQITLIMGLAILIEATLSFLGLGIKPPTAAWGSMANDGYKYLALRPLLSLAPAAAIMLVVFAFNMVGDGLRDALDPRLKNLL